MFPSSLPKTALRSSSLSTQMGPTVMHLATKMLSDGICPGSLMWMSWHWRRREPSCGCSSRTSTPAEEPTAAVMLRVVVQRRMCWKRMVTLEMTLRQSESVNWKECMARKNDWKTGSLCDFVNAGIWSWPWREWQGWGLRLFIFHGCGRGGRARGWDWGEHRRWMPGKERPEGRHVTDPLMFAWTHMHAMMNRWRLPVFSEIGTPFE